MVKVADVSVCYLSCLTRLFLVHTNLNWIVSINDHKGKSESIYSI